MTWSQPYSVHCVTGDQEAGSVLRLQVGISRLREDADLSKVRLEPGPALLPCLDLTPGPLPPPIICAPHSRHIYRL